MSLIFFRKHPVGHVFDKAIQDWKSSADPKFGAMASNVTYDHRVSREREEELAKIAGSDPSGTELGNAFKKYFETKVRTRDLPHFVYEKLNEENILGLTPGGWKGPDRETLFVRVLDLSGLYHPMHWAKEKQNPVFKDFPDQMMQGPGWVDKQLTGVGKWANKFEAFLHELLLVMEGYGKEHPFQPTWVTTWATFKPLLGKGPNGWLEVLGVPKKEGRRWVVLLAYPASEARKFARPTQLDAGWFAQHFPSPTCAPAELGGHPMDLAADPATPIRPEYIHRSMAHTLPHWHLAERNFGPADGPARDDLKKQRQTHYGSLRVEYLPRKIAAWMPLGGL